MKKNKEILKHVPFFYKIINFEFYEDDELSKRLINIYQDYVFKVDITDKKEVEKLESIDKVLNKYIEDYSFRKELKREMQNIKVRKDEDILTAIVNWVIKTYDNYEFGYTKNIYFSRWI